MNKCSYCGRDLQPEEYMLQLKGKEITKNLCGQCLFKVIDHVYQSFDTSAKGEDE